MWSDVTVMVIVLIVGTVAWWALAFGGIEIKTRCKQPRNRDRNPCSNIRESERGSTEGETCDDQEPPPP